MANTADGLGKSVVVESKPGGGGDIRIELVAKAKPDGYTLLMASATYLVRAGVFKVPYEGAGAAFTDLLANQAQVGILTLPSALPYTKSDKLRPLAVTSEKRTLALPDLPTMKEAGIDNFTVGQWQDLIKNIGLRKH